MPDLQLSKALAAGVAEQSAEILPIIDGYLAKAVFAVGADPIKLGLVASPNRPGGNITGVSFLSAELTGKRLDLLR